MYHILKDEDIIRSLPMAVAVETIEKALLAKNKGRLIAPPRFLVTAGKGALVFTAGADPDETHSIGFRVYDTFPDDMPDRTQLVAVFDSRTGAFRGMVIGEMIGAIRTAAINAIAIKHMAQPEVKRLGILGSGLQARTHIQAALVVRQFDSALVFSPTESHREAFADEMHSKTGIRIEASSSAEEVVRQAEVLICATNSQAAVLEADWLSPGTHINTIGPKLKKGHELPVEVARKSHHIATDSLQQVDGFNSYSSPFFLQDSNERKRIVELDQIVAKKRKGRTGSSELTLFCSVGLAGTEVVLADKAFQLYTGKTVN